MFLSVPNPPGGTVALAIAVFCATFLLADNCLAADSKTSSNQRLSTGWEYDDNVFEAPGNRIGNGSAVASFFTGTRSRFVNYVTDFNFQAGYKAYHKLSDSKEDSLVAGDIMTGKADFHVVRFFGSRWLLSGDFDLKWRGVYRKNSLNLLDEEGYVRGWAKVGASRTLEDGRAQAFLGYRASFYDYETFDSFNNHAHSAIARYSRRLTGRFSGAAEYSFSRRNYERNIADPDKDGKIVERDENQRDNIHRLDLSVSYSGSQVLNLIYSLQRNDSNNYGFSYWNNRVSLVYGRLLPWNILPEQLRIPRIQAVFR